MERIITLIIMDVTIYDKLYRFYSKLCSINFPTWYLCTYKNKIITQYKLLLELFVDRNDIVIFNIFISKIRFSKVYLIQSITKIWFIKTFNSFKSINDFIDIVCSYNEHTNDGIVKDEDYYNEFNNILRYIVKKYKKYKRKNYIILNVI